MSCIMEENLDYDCSPKCRSRQHCHQLNVAISKGNLRQTQLFLSRCHNAGAISDSHGRTALHMAASCGKWEVIDWLLTEKGAELGTKDWESGWTALHRALFYGHLTSARLLISHGASIQVRDVEGLTALDVLKKDKLSHVELSNTGLNEAVTWGDNRNFTLGHDSEQSKRHPEIIEYFRKHSIIIQQVVMSKYHSVFLSNSGHVYTCGHGHGGRLGHGNEQTYLVPHRVLALKQEVCVQVAAGRDHTVMLMERFDILTIRLGRIATAAAMMLTERLSNVNNTLRSITTAARDHAVMLTESGVVYSCGLNACHQLGHSPPPKSSLVPKQVSGKVLKGRSLKGICAQRYHTVIYTEDAVFTFGLNAGQLGHMKVPGERLITQPRQVSGLIHKHIQVKYVGASDGANVVVTRNGDVYLLQGYHCKKILSRWLDLEQVAVSGGHLDQSADTAVLHEGGGTEAVVALLNSAGRVYVWRLSEPVAKRCTWGVRRPLHVTQISLGVHNVALITKDGDAYLATLSRIMGSKDLSSTFSKDMVAGCPPQTGWSHSTSELLEQDLVDDLKAQRVPYVHRAVALAGDSKGGNFAVLQTQANASVTEVPSVCGSDMTQHFQVLLEEAVVGDAVHDVILQVDNHQMAAHRYILASRSDFFRKTLCDSTGTLEVSTIHVENVNLVVFGQLLKFIYTDSCDLLEIGGKFTCDSAGPSHSPPGSVRSDSGKDVNCGSGPESFIDASLATRNLNSVSAFEVYQKSRRKDKKSPGEKERGSGDKQGKGEDAVTGTSPQDASPIKDPVKVLLEMAKRFGVKSLVKRLPAVKWVSGRIAAVPGKHRPAPHLKLDRSKDLGLCDVCIHASDGVEFQCHKCVLVARLEYFSSMLASGWIETSNTKSLTLPVPGDILHIVLNYLYTDDTVFDGVLDVELLCNILVVADQLLILRLKDMCQVAIAQLLTLKNVCEVLEFSSVYNASQLKVTCQQFITINIAMLLEVRALDVLSDEVVVELAQYYRDTVSGVQYRLITPYEGWPDHAYLEQLEAQQQGVEIKHPHHPGATEDVTTKKTPGRSKKRQKRRSIGDDGAEKKTETQSRRGNERQLSVSSDTDLHIDAEHAEQGQTSPTLSPPPKSTSTSSDGTQEKARTVSPPQSTWAQRTRTWGQALMLPSLKIPEPSQGQGQGQAQALVSPPVSPSQTSGQPASPRGLRDIMEEEASRGMRVTMVTTPVAPQECKVALQKSASSQSASKRSGKMSQRERKRQLSFHGDDPQTNQSETASVDPLESGTPKARAQAAAASPWGAITNVVHSFKDLMLGEDGQGDAPQSGPRPKATAPKATAPATKATAPKATAPKATATKATAPKVVKAPTSPRASNVSRSPVDDTSFSWGLTSTVASKSTKGALGSDKDAPESPPASNPWVASESPAAPGRGSGTSHKFTDIVEDEIQQRITLQRNTNKPLSLIQIEEQAIGELLEHYRAQEATDECISVERVPVQLARPTWEATQRQRHV